MNLARKIAGRLLRPFRAAYYRRLYGRPSGLARAVDAWMARWERAAGWGDVPAPQGEWEDQYRGGAWDFLHRPDERPRYRALADLLRDLDPASTLLDVGCGDGLLFEELVATDIAGYTGVDLSREAVDRAEGRIADPRARFVAADGEAYVPDRAYDAVVFNESLYYFRNPLATVERYLPFLTGNGRLVVSMYATPRTEAIARLLRDRWPVEAEVEVPYGAPRWRLFRLRPAS